jgi:hypothetical protein
MELLGLAFVIVVLYFHYFYQPNLGAKIAFNHGNGYWGWYAKLVAFGPFGLLWLLAKHKDDISKLERNAFIFLFSCHVVIFVTIFIVVTIVNK